MTCPRVSFKTQPQLFIESRTRAPVVAMVKLQAETNTLWKARQEEHSVTKNGQKLGCN